jgi:hypothetical protein
VVTANGKFTNVGDVLGLFHVAVPEFAWKT